jgi:hypothetical protein
MNRSWIERYLADSTIVEKSISGLTKEEMTSFPVPGTWSIQQIVIHLMDSDLIGSDRMKRVIAENNPSIIAYDETAFSKSLFYHELDPKIAAEVFRLNRIMTAEVLKRLPDEAFSRTGVHSERGVESLADLVEGYVDHVQHHIKFLKEKRKVLGKPLD